MGTKPDYDAIAKKFFSGTKKEDLPSADALLRALELAKGTKFRVSPNLLKRIRDEHAAKVAAEGEACGRCDFDWTSCQVCDVPDDKCTECDALDCYPGIGPDYSHH